MATTHIKGSRMALKCTLPSPSPTSLPRTKQFFDNWSDFGGLPGIRGFVPSSYVTLTLWPGFNTKNKPLWTQFRELESTRISQRVLEELEMLGELHLGATPRLLAPHTFVKLKLGCVCVCVKSYHTGWTSNAVYEGLYSPSWIAQPGVQTSHPGRATWAPEERKGTGHVAPLVNLLLLRQRSHGALPVPGIRFPGCFSF